MTSRTQYIATETLISVVINTALSIGFVFAFFHKLSAVPVVGVHGIIADMAPQTFMVVLMSCLVPVVLTTRRAAAGSLAWHAGAGSASMSGVGVTAVICGFLAMLSVVTICWIVLPHLLPSTVSFRHLIVGKAIFGMILAAVTTPWAIARVLGPHPG